MHYEKVQAELERLHIEGLQINKTFMDFVNKQIAEAIKKFAERLKEHTTTARFGQGIYSYNIVTEQSIDNLVKEMVGE